ncbi:MAG: hypothetical protein WD530_03090 [Vicingaceae bacterium]
MNIVSQYPWWMYVLCLILGAVYAFVLYQKDRKLTDFSSILINFLAVLRFLTVSFLAILLLAPLIKYMSKRVEPPIIILAQDNSASILKSKDSALYQNSLKEEVEKLKSELQTNFQVEHFFFDEELKDAADSLPNYQGRETNFQLLLDGIEDRFVNRNVGAVLVVSDGIYNRGANPAYQSIKQSYPIYTLALGDTSLKKDALIKRLLHNEIAYLNNEFPLEVDLIFHQIESRSGRLRLMKNGKTIEEKRVDLSESGDLQTVRFNVKAEAVGLQRYTVLLEEFEGEVNLTNNRRDFYIDVLDGRQQILLLYDGVHPDIAAINAAIQKQENYRLKTVQIDDFDGKLDEFNLVILYQLPTVQSNLKNLRAKLEEEKIAQLFFLGSQSAFTPLNQWNLPLQFDVNSGEINDVYPQFNDAFPLFKLEENQVKLILSLPPLKVPFGKYTLNNQAYHLFSQKVGAVETNYPLIAFQEIEGVKKGVFMGEGIWHWRLSEYAMNQNHELVDDLVQKIVQYMAVKADKSYFRISHEKKFYENESISFELQLYNDSYEAVNEPEVELSLWDENGREYTYTFSRTSDAYFLQINSLPVGNYSYRATTQLGNKKYEEKGQFSVEEIQLESIETRANHNVLFQLAEKSGGKMLYLPNLSDFPQELKSRKDIASISYADEAVEDIINVKWIFYILLFLLSLEWFLRKRNGAY